MKNKTLWWQYLRWIWRLVFCFCFFPELDPSWLSLPSAFPLGASVFLLHTSGFCSLFGQDFHSGAFWISKLSGKHFYYYYYCNRKADTILSSRQKKKKILYVQSCLQISFVCYKFLHCLYKQIRSEKTLSAGRSAGIFVFLLRSSGRLMCWDTGTALSTDVRALGPWSAQGSWWALLLRSWLLGQNVRTPQEAIQPLRHFQGGQDCRCCVAKGMMFVCIYYSLPYLQGINLFFAVLLSLRVMQRGGTGGRALAFQHGDDFKCYQTILCQILSSLQVDNLLWHALFGRAPWPSSLPSALKQSLVWNPRWVFCVRGKGFPFPVLAFEVERHMFPKRCILPKKGMVDPPLPLVFVCIRRVAVSLVVWVWFCLRMGWQESGVALG